MHASESLGMADVVEIFSLHIDLSYPMSRGGESKRGSSTGFPVAEGK